MSQTLEALSVAARKLALEIARTGWAPENEVGLCACQEAMSGKFDECRPDQVLWALKGAPVHVLDATEKAVADFRKAEKAHEEMAVKARAASSAPAVEARTTSVERVNQYGRAENDPNQTRGFWKD